MFTHTSSLIGTRPTRLHTSVFWLIVFPCVILLIASPHCLLSDYAFRTSGPRPTFPGTATCRGRHTLPSPCTDLCISSCSRTDVSGGVFRGRACSQLAPCDCTLCSSRCNCAPCEPCNAAALISDLAQKAVIIACDDLSLLTCTTAPFDLFQVLSNHWFSSS